MSQARMRNRLRVKAVAVSRAFKLLLRPPAASRRWLAVLVAVARRLLAGPAATRAWAYRAVFMSDGLQLRHSAEHVLADLREFCFAGKTAFAPDALTMARREGRREVFLRITNYLNLDEGQVQLLMEIDDGFE